VSHPAEQCTAVDGRVFNPLVTGHVTYVLEEETISRQAPSQFSITSTLHKQHNNNPRTARPGQYLDALLGHAPKADGGAPASEVKLTGADPKLAS
jgi:hypothetical protein